MPLKVPSTTNLDVIFARLHYRRSQLYEKERLLHLCELKGLPNFAAELYPEQGIRDHRQLQKRLTEDAFSSMEWITDFLSGREFELFSWLLRRYVVENLKVLFRGYHGKHPPTEVERHLVSLAPGFALPAEKMITAPDLATFASLVPDAALCEGVQQAADLFGRKGQVFFFDSALDMFYYDRLAGLLHTASASDMRTSMPVISADVGTYAIMVALRAKHNYGVSFDEIAPVLDIKLGLHLNDLRKLYAADSVASAVQRLPGTFRTAVTGSVETVEALERALGTFLCRRANNAFYSAGITLGVAVAFYYLKRIELGNLVRLAEAYHYEFSAGEMRSILVPPVE